MSFRHCSCFALLVLLGLFALSTNTVYAIEPELPDNYITGITQAEDIQEGFTYEFVEFDNMYLENVVIGTPDEFSITESGVPNLYRFSGTGKFSSLSGSTAGYNSTTNNYNFVATGTILIPLEDLTSDYEWILNEEYTFTLLNGYVNVSSNLGGITASYNPTAFNDALVNQRKFKTCGANFRPLNNDIVNLTFDSTINSSTQVASYYNYNLSATQTNYGTSFKVSNINGDALVTYTGDVSGKKYYLGVTFTKGFSATGSSQTSVVPSSESYISNSAVVQATSFDFPYSGEITIQYDLPVDENTTLLTGILDWIKGIYNSIVELPSTIWTYMSNGLRDLFIPSEEAITEMKDKWDVLLATRFGAVYQAGDILIDFASGIEVQEEQGSITFPSVTYNFSGTDFTFGGYEVDIIPDGFEWLVEILKGVIDIVCTIAFLNALRKKYDDLMEG